MEANSRIGIAGLKIINPDGSIQLSCRSFPSYTTALFHRYSLLTRWFPNNPFSRRYLRMDLSRDRMQEVDWVSGACLLHKRTLLNSIGYLDESFFMYCEDVDFCFRAKKAGWQVLYYPAAAVMHHIGGSSSKASRRMILKRHESMWNYYAKHYRRNFLKDGIVGGAIAFRCFLYLTLSLLGKVKP